MSKYTIKRRDRKVPIFMSILIAVIIGFGIADVCGVFDGPVEPDAVYEMCNQHIEWTYAGKR